MQKVTDISQMIHKTKVFVKTTFQRQQKYFIQFHYYGVERYYVEALRHCVRPFVRTSVRTPLNVTEKCVDAHTDIDRHVLTYLTDIGT